MCFLVTVWSFHLIYLWDTLLRYCPACGYFLYYQKASTVLFQAFRKVQDRNKVTCLKHFKCCSSLWEQTPVSLPCFHRREKVKTKPGKSVPVCALAGQWTQCCSVYAFTSLFIIDPSKRIMQAFLIRKSILKLRKQDPSHQRACYNQQPSLRTFG